MSESNPISAKQLAANRANAQRSTGPTTPAGKARSRWNALTHGALSRAIIPPSLEPYESRQNYDDLLSSLIQDLAPATTMEQMLVENIAVNYWRLSRLLRAEAASIARSQQRLARTLAMEPAEPSKFESPDNLNVATNLLTNQIDVLTHALHDIPKLRQRLSKQEPRYREASDEELRAAGRELIAGLKAQLAEEQEQDASARRDAQSMPSLEYLNLSTRYETTLQHQIYRALNELERLQRQRGGEYVPPPLSANIDAVISAFNPDAPNSPVRDEIT